MRAPFSVQFISFSCSFLATFFLNKTFLPWTEGLAPPSHGKSWIRHWSSSTRSKLNRNKFFENLKFFSFFSDGENMEGTCSRCVLPATWNDYLSFPEGYPMGTTSLMHAAWMGHNRCVAELLAAGADVNTETRYGRSALTFTALAGNHACMAALIRAGADVNFPSDRGLSPLVCACYAGTRSCVRLLLQVSNGLYTLDRTGPNPVQCEWAISRHCIHAGRGTKFVLFTNSIRLVGIAFEIVTKTLPVEFFTS